jgi:hypothetical protein
MLANSKRFNLTLEGLIHDSMIQVILNRDDFDFDDLDSDLSEEICGVLRFF